MFADYIVHGTIYTGNSEELFVESFGVKDDKILFTGSEQEAEKYTDEKTKHLRAGFVSSGYTDGHAHISFARNVAAGIQLSGIHTAEECLEKIREYARQNPGRKFVFGQGFSPSDFGEEGPKKELLDDVYPDTPVVLQSDSCHDLWVNSAFLRMAGIDADTLDVPNGEIVRDKDTGEPTGWFREAATEICSEHYPEATIQEYKEAILYFQDMVLPYGTINVFEPICNHEGDYEKIVQAYHELEQEGKLKLRVRAAYHMGEGDSVERLLEQAVRLRRETKGEHFELTTIKLFTDGVVEGRTAYLRDDYSDEPGFRGDPLWEQDALNYACEKSLEAGFSIHTHAIGDAALDQILDALEHAQKKTGITDRRNAVTHLQVVEPDQYKRLAELGIVAVINTFWHYKEHSYYFSMELPFLGDRAKIEYPVKSLLKEGAILSQASDWPVTQPPEPLTGLEIGITRREPGNLSSSPLSEREAISAEEMYQILTSGGAWQMGLEEQTGKIEAGKKADFIVLEKNPFLVEADEIHRISVLATYVDGKPAYEKKDK